jgi:hypothetical protein
MSPNASEPTISPTAVKTIAAVIGRTGDPA